MAPDRLLGNRSFWDERAYPDDRIKLIGHVEQLVRGDLESCVHRLVDDRGLPVWVSHSFRRVQTVAGAVIRGCLTPLRTEDCLDKLDTEVISQFVHKIGNHFQLINLLLSSLRRNAVPTEDGNLLEHAVDRTVEFIRTFLNYSQGLTSRCEIDLGEILRVAIHSALPSFLAKRINLIDLIDEPHGHASLFGDPLLLEIALSALLQNAAEATNIGDEIVVKFKIDQPCLRMGVVGEISIIDPGNGIGADELANVRAPFYSTRRDRDGLGLSLAARIVDLHGGVLKLSSEIGRGTRVDVLLPLTATGPTSER
jgi:signal transduction histidine kinase